MNPFLAIFFLSYLSYCLFNNIKFIFIYFGLLGLYHFITQVKYFKTEYDKGRRKMLIASWNTPYDPQTLVKFKLDITKIEKYLEDYSTKSGEKVTLTIFVIRLMAVVLQKFPEIDGYIRFGKVISKINNSTTLKKM